ncbi:glycine betaine transporter 1 [Nematostella vectensis]|uniref:glycine betaine transporter 1 n=1 Tax=Nematostella vectensis TaxID=45351 RepID=UPI00207730E9|nr:glycine betaine transporter 1 [Nematostella vectensis]
MSDPEVEDREAREIRRKCRTVEFSIWKLRVSLNPVVTIISAIIIWGFVVFCLRWTDLAGDSLPKGKRWVTKVWTWLYIGTQDVWAVFIVALYFSKYGKLKLGKDHEKPEYSDATYFTMLFAAGIGVGLFYFGVAEPIYHYEPGSQWGNRYQGRYSDNQRAQDAINITIFHWGVHGWIVYTMIGLILGFLSHRKKMPMTMRSCFHPLLGDKIYGTLGDMIDILSVVCTILGVCTSLGLGVIQINNGMNRMNKNIEESKENQVIIIWCITAVATLSVISGVKLGIRRLSELCFSIGMFIWFVVFFYDDTWYILNIFCQSVGYYLQWLIQLGFHTDAFAQAGNAPDGKQAVDWMDGWTIFYWGWWIAWSPFVGTFIARISRGRTIQEFIMYTLTVPTIYSLMWFSVFGGAGLKMERNAAIAGINCSWPLGGATATEPYNGLYRLSCRPSTSMWFDVVESYGGLGTFMSGISLVSLVLYFVTSSDSGSLVVDSLSANGHPDPPVLQRIFWALTEGATATALLWTGGKRALDALQAASICSGLFYTVILNFIVVAMWRLLKIEMGDLSPDHPQFSFGLLDIFYYPTCRRIKDLLIAIIAPWWPMGNAAGRLYGQNRFVFMAIIAVPFYGWLICEILQVLEVGLAYIGWAILFGFFAYGTGIRSHMRDEFKILGNLAEDFFAVMLLYPLAAMQMDEHMRHAHPRRAEVGKENVAMDDMPPKDLEANTDRNGLPSYNDVDMGKF